MGEKHILLADADAETLREFQQALGQQWNVTGVETGAAALAALKKQPYDGLVASLHLTDIETSQLFNRVRTKYPKTVRFVVAGEKDRQRVVKEVLGAHQFLTRPFNAEELRNSIERALAFELWIANDKLRELVARMRTLPTVPALYLEILAALRSADTTTEEVGALIAKDMSIMTKLLQVINSAYFGLPRTITSPEEAVGLLGFETVKSMVMAIKLLNQYDRIKPGDFSIDGLWQHSTAVAQGARRLTLLQTGNRARAEEAFAAGLMHDVGKVVLAGNFGDQYRGAQSLAVNQKIPLWQVEREIFGASHGEVGAYLLGLWGLPLEIMEAAALHHQPSRSVNQGFTALTAVHVANVLEGERSTDVERQAAPKIDTAYLSEIGVLECVPAWREEILGPEAKDPDLVPEEPAARPSSPCVPGPALASVPPPSLAINSPDPSVGGNSCEVQTFEAGGLVPCETSCPPQPCADEAEPETVCSEEPGSPAPAAIATPRKSRWLYAEVAVALILLVVWFVIARLARQEDQAIDVNAEQARPAPVAAVSEPVPAPTTLSQEARDAAPLAAGATDLTPAAANVNPPPGSAGSSNSVFPASASAPSGDLSEPPTMPAIESFPALKLQGILFSHDHPSAIINGVLVHPNERLLGVRVVEIRSNSVSLEYQHQRKVLSLE